MSGKGEIKLSLCLVGRLELEASSGERVNQLDRNEAAVGFTVLVGIVSNQSNRLKVVVREVVSRRDLGRVVRADVSSANQHFCNCGIGVHERS